jgi:predicted amidohydrolase
MKILGLQIDLAWQDPAANIARFDALIESIAALAPDLVVLPEMWTTGFTMAPEAADPSGFEAGLEAMKRWSERTNAAWYGSLVARDGFSFRNRGAFVKPGGEVSTYDKRHLFTFAGEPDHYVPGQERVIVEWRGWRILTQICYDLRFPVFSRNLGDWDLALYVANWPAVRSNAWSTLLAARAIENCAWVCGVNRTGTDGNDQTYDGQSAISGPRGEQILTTHIQPGVDFVLADLSLDDLKAYRLKFPALEDRDDFKLRF